MKLLAKNGLHPQVQLDQARRKVRLICPLAEAGAFGVVLELVTPEQRALLGKLAQAPAPTKPWAYYEQQGDRAVLRGAMPPAYRDLGRFRNALLLEEYEAHPTPSLAAFIRLNGLQASRR